MTLRHLKIFVTVCEQMNMTSAAKALFMSQSAVSQAIAELEKFYGVRLLDRMPKKLFLTPAGEALLGYARRMLRMNEEIEKSMKTLADGGTVRIGASVTVGSTVLPGLVLRYQRENPEVKVEVFEDNTRQIEKRLLSDISDIGLVEGEVTSPELVSRPFLEDELVLICGGRHRFAARSSVKPEELEREPFIIREEGSGTRQTFEKAMKQLGVSYQAAWTCNNADTIRTAVAAGLGISVISLRAVEAEVKNGVLFAKKVDGVRFVRQFKVVVHKNKYLTAAMHKLIGYCLAGVEKA